MLKFSEIIEFSRENSYFERIRMVRMVRMVRSLADRTFQLWLVLSWWARQLMGLRPMLALLLFNLCWGIFDFSKMHFSKILQIFGGLVLGCIKTKFCKKICVRQYFSSSTRFAYFCTAAISKNFAKNRFEKSAFFVKIQQQFCKCRNNCNICQISKKFS